MDEDTDETRVIVVSNDITPNSASKAERQLRKKHQNFRWKLAAKEQVERINERHYNYYSLQLPGMDWTSFNATMTTKLPVTFRLCSLRAPFVCQMLRRLITKKVQELTLPITLPSGEMVNQIMRPVACNPDTYQLHIDSSTLKNYIPLAPLHTLLIREIALGHVVRQELVSMIPAIVLGVQPHHHVLDICAAPGSKTEQLMSYLSPRDGRSYQGMLVVNDADTKRIHTLTQRFNNCMSPNVLVTCAKAHHLQQAIGCRAFDRIVCDVPCTGDGTFRKCPHLWRLFRPRFALELHATQLDIAISCLLMLKPGGRMVYSTCSLNPIEDEAVVAALILYARSIGMDIVLFDPRSAEKGEPIVPGLAWHDGVTSWRCDEDIAFAGETPEEKKESRKRLKDFATTMHCPPQETVQSLHLTRCMRIFPQDQDTGGFFVAILDYIGDYKSSQPEARRNSIERNSSTSNKAFQQLGYNPKQQEVSSNKRKRDSAGILYDDLHENDACCDAVFDMLTGRLPTDLIMCVASIAEDHGDVSPVRVDVLSNEVMQALQLWGNRSGLVTQAGAKAFDITLKRRMEMVPDTCGARLIAPRVDLDMTTFFGIVANVRQMMRSENSSVTVDLSSYTIATASDLLCLGLNSNALTLPKPVEEVQQKRRMSKAERKKAKKGVAVPLNTVTSNDCAGASSSTLQILPFEMSLVLRRSSASSYQVLSPVDEVNSYYDCCKIFSIGPQVSGVKV